MKLVAEWVDCIAWFNKDGIPTPIKFKITEDEDYVIKVDKVIDRRKEKLAGIPMFVYNCIGIINGLEKCFELKFDIENCKWMLWRM